METSTILICYSVGVILASIIGGVIPTVCRLSHRSLEIAVSFVAGLMLGMTFFHLLPHASQHLSSFRALSVYLLLGLLLMFFLERFFCFHHHESPMEEEEGGCAHHSHDHTLSWTGVTVGLVVHSILAGVALAASVEAEQLVNPGALAGLGVFLAVALHKPFDALTISTLMTASNRSIKSVLFVNFLFALAVPLGMFLFSIGMNELFVNHQFLGVSLAVSAGIFLCVSLSDLLPELQFHSHDRVKLSIALLAGLILAWMLGVVEVDGSHLPHELHTSG